MQAENNLNVTGQLSAQSLTTSSGCVEDQDNGAAYDTLPRPTILGARLVGTPYSVATMQQASMNLYGTTSGITENRWYVRFKPADPRQLSILDSLKLDLFDYPLDYEVTQEGDYYNVGVTPAETIPLLYTVVPVNFVFPAGIQYELLQRMHLPTLASLEREAFRLTGNPVPDTTCSTVILTKNEKGITPNSEPVGGCPTGTKWDPVSRMCVDDVVTSPPAPSPTRQPSGTVVVFDNNRNANVPVRNVRVVVKHRMNVERVFTNNQGQYAVSREFNRGNILIRTKNDQATIRALRRARLWQILFPVEVHFGKFKGALNNIQHVIGQNTNALSSGARHWAAATAHNNVQEYYEYAAQSGIGTPPGGFKVLLTNWRLQGPRGAAPMFAKRFWQTMPTDFLAFYVISSSSAVAGGLTALALVVKYEIDITLGYNNFRRAGTDLTITSDELSETMLHETTHAAHYNKVGNTYWADFVNAELSQMVTNNPPYGNGTAGATSQLIALGESWAYHMGHFLSDRKYGTISSDAIEQGHRYINNEFIAGSSHINLLEDFSTDRLADPDRWIPQGLYYDLMDNRNDATVAFPRVNLNDLVTGYTNQQFFNALDPDIRSLGAFQTRLLSENGNNQAAGVNTIFSFYVR